MKEHEISKYPNITDFNLEQLGRALEQKLKKTK